MDTKKIIEIIIDRFEGEFAVVELQSKELVNMPIALIPPGAKEGDVIAILVDKSETNKREKRIKKMMDDLYRS